MIYDLIVIGMGPSGMAAAVYAKRNGLNVLILEKSMPGGLVNNSSEVDNYLGYPGIKGIDLVANFVSHISSLDIPYKIEEVKDIKLEQDIKKVITAKEEYNTKNIIIATGRSPELLGLPKEKELIGRGISTCALCDGVFFKDKVIAVVGGGNSALEEAIHLSSIVSKIYLIHRRENLRGEEILRSSVESKDNIEIIYNSEITKLLEAGNKLSGIELNNKEVINIEGLFIYIGYKPNTEVFKNIVATNKEGYIKVNQYYETSVSGIYAVGDIIEKEYYQIITAVNEGSVAALNISRIK